MSNKPLKIIAGAPDRPLIIGGIEIPCYVLEKEIRVLSERGVTASIGLNPDAGFRMPQLMATKSLRPFVIKDLLPALSELILFKNPVGGGNVHGYPASILVDICRAILAARAAGALPKQQLYIAERCEIVTLGLASVGINALVDEATGYQEMRAKNALAAILEKFLADEVGKWTKTFPLSFYEQIFRLRDWAWPATAAAKKKKPYTPKVIGRYTNDIVYERLAPGVLNELRKRNPKGCKGERPKKHHQWLTPDFGYPALKEHLAAVTALMRASPNWNVFQRNLKRAFPKQGETLSIPSDDE